MDTIVKNAEGEVRTFKSLYEVLNTYMPNKDLRFLEVQEDEEALLSFMKIKEKQEQEKQAMTTEKTE